MNIKHFQAFIEAPKPDGIKGSQFMVMTVLLRHENVLTGECFPSVGVIMRETGLKLSVVKKARKELAELGVISIIHDRHTNDGVGCRYLINSDRFKTAWMGHARAPSEGSRWVTFDSISSEDATRRRVTNCAQMGRRRDPEGISKKVFKESTMVSKVATSASVRPKLSPDFPFAERLPEEYTGEQVEAIQEQWWAGWENRLETDPIVALMELVEEDGVVETGRAITGYLFQLIKKFGLDKAKQLLVDTGKRILAERSIASKPQNPGSLLMDRLEKTVEFGTAEFEGLEERKLTQGSALKG